MKRLVKSRTNRMVDGVLGGIGEYLQVDPVLVRIIFLLFAFLTTFGPAIIIYIIAMFIIPSSDKSTDSYKSNEEKAPFSQEWSSSVRNHSASPAKNGSLLFGFILIILGILFLLNNFLDYNVFYYIRRFGEYFWPLLIVGIGLWLLFRGRR